MLLQALEIDWRSKALEKMAELCDLEIELGAWQEREKAHRLYSNRMRRALIEISQLPGAGAALARRALGMEE